MQSNQEKLGEIYAKSAGFHLVLAENSHKLGVSYKYFPAYIQRLKATL